MLGYASLDAHAFAGPVAVAAPRTTWQIQLVKINLVKTPCNATSKLLSVRPSTDALLILDGFPVI